MIPLLSALPLHEIISKLSLKCMLENSEGAASCAFFSRRLYSPQATHDILLLQFHSVPPHKPLAVIACFALIFSSLRSRRVHRHHSFRKNILIHGGQHIVFVCFGFIVSPPSNPHATIKCFASVSMPKNLRFQLHTGCLRNFLLAAPRAHFFGNVEFLIPTQQHTLCP